jgi:hypothetical protein
MIWFLLLSIVNGQPVLTPYANQSDACVAFAQAPAGAKVYQVTDGRKVEIAEGDCKPIVSFQKK